MRWSNCVIEGVRLYRMLRRARRAAGRTEPGDEIYWWGRESRAKNAPGHVGVGLLDKKTDQLRMLSFKPVVSEDLPWYLAWKRLRFIGRYRWGDFPDTKPQPIGRRHFSNWPSVRDALEIAYVELGLQMIQTSPGTKEYPAEHWNIAGLVHDHAAGQYRRLVGSCVDCRSALNYHSVIRCLDCKSTFCETCAAMHFGPTHRGRAVAAHA